MNLDTEIMGSGDVAISGEVAALEVEIMGSGDFDGRKLSAEAAKGGVAGSGDIVIGHANKSRFNSHGSGTVEIIGSN